MQVLPARDPLSAKVKRGIEMSERLAFRPFVGGFPLHYPEELLREHSAHADPTLRGKSSYALQQALIDSKGDVLFHYSLLSVYT
jgi:hypothetical protein